MLPFQQVHGRSGNLSVEQGVSQMVGLQIFAVSLHNKLGHLLGFCDQGQKVRGTFMWFRAYPEGGFGESNNSIFIRPCVQELQKTFLGILGGK